jgi:hypothetical protein
MSEEKKEEFVPTFKDAKWSDWVLSKLESDELIDGAPKTDGLRRLVEAYVGEIVDMKSVIVQPPNNENFNTAVVTVRVHILKDGDVKSFSGSADASTRNSDPPYNQYPTAIAETRAYGRAFRNILRIRTAVAEELSKNAEYVSETSDSDRKITGPQIKGIDNLCKLLDINVETFINSGELKYKSIKEVPLNKGTLIMKTLNEYQNNSRNKIPETFLGYKKEWRDSFMGE